jgi:glycosyltransferase involved in cell wall biosynthesis
MSTSDISAALIQLLQDCELARRLGDAGRDRVLNDFSPERQVEEVLAALLPWVSCGLVPVRSP